MDRKLVKRRQKEGSATKRERKLGSDLVYFKWNDRNRTFGLRNLRHRTPCGRRMSRHSQDVVCLQNF